ncbi:MAG TPA: FAD:protein FMN transferase [Streptosporangiaceae bacterium]|nr:FAD:protein FMN transferase [Streptosporangiaceae bacterium]
MTSDLPTRDRLRHAEDVMGTVFSFDVPAAAAGTLPQVLAWLHWVDATFSTYRADSDVNRFGRGELALTQCVPELAEVIGECAVIRDRSGGYFTDMPGGTFDPSGLVKGWAIEHAAAMLSAAGFTGHTVNGAGDMQCTGEPEPGRPWRIGVTDPLHPGRLAFVVAGRDFAVATSGTAERGHHIIDPHTGRPATELASVTVVGPRITAADAYATAAFAMGARAREWVESLEGYEAFAITAKGARWQTSRFRAYGAPA